jgi:hypothetical protein
MITTFSKPEVLAILDSIAMSVVISDIGLVCFEIRVTDCDGNDHRERLPLTGAIVSAILRGSHDCNIGDGVRDMIRDAVEKAFAITKDGLERLAHHGPECLEEPCLTEETLEEVLGFLPRY